MKFKNWEQIAGGRSGLIVIRALAVLSLILILEHILKLGQFLSVNNHSDIKWGEIIVDLAIILSIGVISLTLIHASESRRRRAERALLYDEGRYRDLFENSPLGFYRTTPDGRILLANSALIQMLGYTSLGELEKRNLEKEGFEPKYQRSQFKEIIDKMGEVKGLESAWIRRDKKVLFVRENAKAIRDEDGKILYYEGTAEDITERKKAEEALRQSEQKYRELVETSIDMIFTLDQNGSFLFANKAWRNRLGFSEEETENLNGFELIHSEDLRNTKERFGEVLQGKIVEGLEFKSKTKDGSLINVVINASPIFDPQGDVIAVLGVGRDITEQKKKEEELIRLSAAVKTSSESIVICDLQGKIVDVNEATLEMYRTENKPDLVGKNVLELISPEERERAIAGMKEVLQRGYAKNREHSICLMDGSRIPVEISTALMKDKKGKPIGFVGITRDISERRKAEEALRASEQRYKMLFERNLAAVYRTTIDGKVLDCNESFARLLSYESAKEIMALRAPEFYFKDTEREEFLRRLQKKGNLTNSEFCMRRKDGKPVWILENVNLFEEENGEVTIQGTVIDITERKKSEQIQSVQYKIANAVSTTRDMQELIKIIHKELGTILDTTNFFISLYDKETDTLSLPYYVDEKDRFTSFPVVKTKTSYVIKKKEPVLVTPEVREKLIQAGEIEAFGTPSKIWLGVPLKIGEEVIGVVAVQSYTDPYAYGEKEMEILKFVSEEIALSIERKKAEEALKESEERFRQFAENIDQVFWLTDWDAKRLLYVNPAFERLYGRSCQSAYQNRMNWQEVIYPEDRERVKEAFSRSADLGQYAEAEYRILREDGTLRWVLDRSYPIRDKHGRIYRFASVAEDITERKEAENALKESEEKFKTLAEESFDSMIIHDMDKVLEVNRTFTKVWGYEPDEIRGASVKKFITPDSYELILEKISSGDEKPYEILAIKKDGTIFPIEIAGRQINYKGKKARIVTARDISERKKAEEELRVSEKKFRTAFDTSPDLFYRISPEGEILDCNQSALDILKYTKVELIGKQISDLYAEESKEDAKKFFQEWLKTGKLRNKELKIITKDGQKIDMELNVNTIYDDKGNVISSISAQRDITERKKIEERLKTEKEFSEKIISTANAIIVGLDKEHKIKLFSKEAERITGYKADEIMGKDWFEIFFKEEMYQEMLEVWKDAWGKDLHGYINPIYSKSRKEIIAQWSNTSIKDSAGEHVMLLCIAVDITERKKAEEALELSEERYRELFDNMDSGVAVYEAIDNGKDFRFRSFNYAGEQIEKVKKENLIGKTILEIFSNAENFSLLKVFERIWRTGKPERTFTEVLKGQKVVGWRENYIYRLPTGEIVSIFEDVTERKKAEEALKESEEKFRTLAEKSFDSIVIHDNDRILEANSTFAYKCGYEPSEITGLSIKDLIAPASYDTVMKNILSKSEKPYEALAVKKDGAVFPVEIVGKEITYKGRKARISTARDISERKKAEQALRESEEKHRTYVENAPDGIFITDSEGRYIDVNQAACRMTGYSRDELLNMTIMQLTPPDAPAEAFENLEELKRKGKTSSEIVIQRKDGSVIYASLDAVALSDGRYMAFCSDITERKSAEEALRESENKFRNLAENLPSMVFINSKGKVVYVNRKCEEVMGYKKEEFYSQDFDFLSIIAPEYKDSIKESYARHLRGQQLDSLEYALITREGRKIEVIITTSLITYQKETAILGIVTDITERKKAEEALRASEEKYRAIVENATDQIFTLDRQCRFLAINKTAAELSRKSVSQMVGKSLFEILPKETAVQFSKNIEEVFETGQSKFIEERMCLGGKEFYNSSTLNPIKDDKGNVVAVTGIVRDTTERKKLQEQLIRTEKLAAVGTLAYGIAHEFNNIMAGILINSELGLATGDPRQIKECFQTIAENSQRASSITHNLLAFARQKEAKKELIDIAEPLKSVLAITRRELEKLNIVMEEKFKPVPKIYCDAGQFSEVFLNMITNARDAMRPRGGKLFIQVDSLKDDVRIIFRDTGCGIPEELRRKIFEPFVTTKGALGKSDIPGTGLGLFLSYGIIDGYQGKIEVESKVGRGTKFTILIPISKNQPVKPPGDAIAEPSVETERRLKILLVDDEKPITLSLKKYLESRGHQVTASLKAKEGLKLFRKDKFDLILSDILMPDMDGIELIQKIREKNKNSRIIVMTGQILKEKEEEAREAGADEVLIKPFRNEILSSTINRVMTKSEAEN